MKALESRLSKLNSTSLALPKFGRYARVKMDVFREVIGVYGKEIVRKWKLRTHIATQRSEAAVLRRMKRFTGPTEDTVLVIGNWCPSNHMRNNPPTMTVGVRRLLSREYTLYSIHEARSSKLCHKCHKETKQAPLWEFKICKNRKCSQSKKTRFSRDWNAAINIRYLADQFIKKGKRPAAFMSTFLDETAKRTVDGVARQR